MRNGSGSARYDPQGPTSLAHTEQAVHVYALRLTSPTATTSCPSSGCRSFIYYPEGCMNDRDYEKLLAQVMRLEGGWLAPYCDLRGISSLRLTTTGRRHQ